MRVCGIDLSLSATGYADERGAMVVRVKGVTGTERLAAIRDALFYRMFFPVEGGVIERRWREDDRSLAPADLMTGSRPLVVLEGYSYGSKGRAIFDVGELGGVIRLTLWEHATPVAVVAPATLKKFTTGKGNASKDQMLAAAIRRWEFEGEDNNAADAYMLRLMGLHHKGIPELGLPEYAQEAVAKVEWPKEAVPA